MDNKVAEIDRDMAEAVKNKPLFTSKVVVEKPFQDRKNVQLMRTALQSEDWKEHFRS